MKLMDRARSRVITDTQTLGSTILTPSKIMKPSSCQTLGSHQSHRWGILVGTMNWEIFEDLKKKTKSTIYFFGIQNFHLFVELHSEQWSFPSFLKLSPKVMFFPQCDYITTMSSVCQLKLKVRKWTRLPIWSKKRNSLQLSCDQSSHDLKTNGGEKIISSNQRKEYTWDEKRVGIFLPFIQPLQIYN